MDAHTICATGDQSWADKLRERVNEWCGSVEAAGMAHVELYPYLPDFFTLLCHLAHDPNLSAHDRTAIRSVLKYVVAPYDLIPEGLLGPAGLRDDLVLAAFAVERLAPTVGLDVLKRLWQGAGDPVAVAHTVLAVAADLVGADVEEQLAAWIPTHSTA